MLIQSQKRRRIGQILLDGGFINNTSLERALKEQYKTNELLGQVLVSMGVLDQVEIDAALSVQEHISNMDESIRSAVKNWVRFLSVLRSSMKNNGITCSRTSKTSVVSHPRPIRFVWAKFLLRPGI